MANKVEIKWTQKKFNKQLSMDSKVQAALHRVAGGIYRAAAADLATHRKTGSHSVKIEKVKNAKYGHVDWVVALEGPAAVSLEFGHWDRDHNRWVAGLYIMSVAKFAGKP